jgi:DNA-directed RNA polymerase subunit RPC12/RpoP
MIKCPQCESKLIQYIYHTLDGYTLYNCLTCNHKGKPSKYRAVAKKNFLKGETDVSKK